MLSTTWRTIVDGCLDALLPPACVFCRGPARGRGAACDDCARRIRIWPRAACEHCGQALPAELAPGPCGQCLKRPPPFARMESLYVYDGPVREAILAWKLQGRDAGVRWLLDASAAHLRQVFSPEDVLLPVPMPLSRMRKTGLHHTASLCRAMARLTGARVETGWLRRAADAGRQSERNRAERWRHARRAFHLAEHARINASEGARLWVVDDIRTTGATLHWACRTLARAAPDASARVHAFSLARTPTMA